MRAETQVSCPDLISHLSHIASNICPIFSIYARYLSILVNSSYHSFIYLPPSMESTWYACKRLLSFCDVPMLNVINPYWICYPLEEAQCCGTFHIINYCVPYIHGVCKTCWTLDNAFYGYYPMFFGFHIWLANCINSVSNAKSEVATEFISAIFRNDLVVLSSSFYPPGWVHSEWHLMIWVAMEKIHPSLQETDSSNDQ